MRRHTQATLPSPALLETEACFHPGPTCLPDAACCWGGSGCWERSCCCGWGSKSLPELLGGGGRHRSSSCVPPTSCRVSAPLGSPTATGRLSTFAPRLPASSSRCSCQSGPVSPMEGSTYDTKIRGVQKRGHPDGYNQPQPGERWGGRRYAPLRRDGRLVPAEGRMAKNRTTALIRISHLR